MRTRRRHSSWSCSMVWWGVLGHGGGWWLKWGVVGKGGEEERSRKGGCGRKCRVKLEGGRLLFSRERKVSRGVGKRGAELWEYKVSGWRSRDGVLRTLDIEIGGRQGRFVVVPGGSSGASRGSWWHRGVRRWSVKVRVRCVESRGCT